MLKISPKFDRAYLLLLFPIASKMIPKVSYLVPAIVPFLFLLAWTLWELAQPVRALRDNRVQGAYLQTFFWLIIFSFSKDLYALLGHGEHTQYYVFSTICSQLLYLVVIYISVRRKKLEELIFLAEWSLLCLIVAAVSSMLGAAAGVEYGSRILTGGAYNEESYETGLLAVKYGVGGFAYVHMIAVIAPVLLVAICKTKNKRKRVLLISSLVASFIMVRQSGLGTPMAVFASEVIFSILWLLFRSRRIVILSGLFMATAMLIFATTPTAFNFLAKGFEALGHTMGAETPVGSRLISAAWSVRGDEDEYAFSRYQLQIRSVETFKRNPIFGVGDYNFGNPIRRQIGGHSCICDRLAAQGIVGIIPLMMFMFSLFGLYKLMSIRFCSKETIGMISIAYAGLFIVMFGNPLEAIPGAMYYFIPSIALYIKKPEEVVAL